jgi:hypothetical protein
VYSRKRNASFFNLVTPIIDLLNQAVQSLNQPSSTGIRVLSKTSRKKFETSFPSFVLPQRSRLSSSTFLLDPMQTGGPEELVKKSSNQSFCQNLNITFSLEKETYIFGILCTVTFQKLLNEHNRTINFSLEK